MRHAIAKEQFFQEVYEAIVVVEFGCLIEVRGFGALVKENETIVVVVVVVVVVGDWMEV